jgi:archaellum component FlaC
MFKLFKQKDKFDSNLYNLMLKMENHQKQIDELRELVLILSKEINELRTEVNYLANERYGKGL